MKISNDTDERIVIEPGSDIVVDGKTIRKNTWGTPAVVIIERVI